MGKVKSTTTTAVSEEAQEASETCSTVEHDVVSTSSERKSRVTASLNTGHNVQIVEIPDPESIDDLANEVDRAIFFHPVRADRSMEVFTYVASEALPTEEYRQIIDTFTTMGEPPLTSTLIIAKEIEDDHSEYDAYCVCVVDGSKEEDYIAPMMFMNTLSRVLKSFTSGKSSDMTMLYLSSFHINPLDTAQIAAINMAIDMSWDESTLGSIHVVYGDESRCKDDSAIEDVASNDEPKKKKDKDKKKKKSKDKEKSKDKDKKKDKKKKKNKK